jgi:hypothetical protein
MEEALPVAFSEASYGAKCLSGKKNNPVKPFFLKTAPFALSWIMHSTTGILGERVIADRRYGKLFG